MLIKKIDEKQHVVFGEVYIPNMPDSQGHFMNEDTIRDMAYKYMIKMDPKSDVNHDHIIVSTSVVESFLVRTGDEDFIEGSWVIGLKIHDESTWEKIEKNEINGFSIEGVGKNVEVEVEVEIPEFLDGVTGDSSGHRHKFRLRLDEEGHIIEGVTDEVDGHTHQILGNVVTEETNGHKHVFSISELLGKLIEAA